MMQETKAKIEKHIRKHRKDGGKAQMGSNDAEKDLESKPERRNNAPKVEDAAEAKEAKKGGRMKRASGGIARKEGGRAEGEDACHHAGRRSRASGGSCESSPFTSAMKGSAPSGRKTMHESQGSNH